MVVVLLSELKKGVRFCVGVLVVGLGRIVRFVFGLVLG